MNPAVRRGKPCVNGTRITVYDVLESLAAGMGDNKTVRAFKISLASRGEEALKYSIPARSPASKPRLVQGDRGYDSPTSS